MSLMWAVSRYAPAWAITYTATQKIWLRLRQSGHALIEVVSRLFVRLEGNCLGQLFLLTQTDWRATALRRQYRCPLLFEAGADHRQFELLWRVATALRIVLTLNANCHQLDAHTSSKGLFMCCVAALRLLWFASAPRQRPSAPSKI